MLDTKKKQPGGDQNAVPEKKLSVKELYAKLEKESIDKPTKGSGLYTMDDIRNAVDKLMKELKKDELLLSAAADIIKDSEPKFADLKYGMIRAAVQYKGKFELKTVDARTWVVRLIVKKE